MGVQFKVVVRNPLEGAAHFEKRLEDSLNEFFEDIESENDVWDFVRILGTGTDTEPGSETYVAHKYLNSKKEKNIGFKIK